MAALVPSAVTVAVSLFVITADRSGIHMHWISKMKFILMSILATAVANVGGHSFITFTLRGRDID